VAPPCATADDLDRSDFGGEVIEVRLHGVQALCVEVDGLHDFVQQVLQALEALIDRQRFRSGANPITLIGRD